MTTSASPARRPAGKALTTIRAAPSLVTAFLQLEAKRRQHALDIVTALTGVAATQQAALGATEHRHFPDDDVFDPHSGAQYFLHRHATAGHHPSLHLHFFQRWSPPELALRDGITTHLAALELNAAGEPQAWFAVNQWVVGDYWQPADETVRLFALWGVASPEVGRGDTVPSLCHRWLTSYLQLSLVPVIYPLLLQRDRVLDQLVDEQPGNNVLEDRRHEVLAVQPVDFRRQLVGWHAIAGTS